MVSETLTKKTESGTIGKLSLGSWIGIGLGTALVSILAVLLVQALVLSIWPEAASFKPLDNYARTAIFTLVPALVATASFAWLARRRPDPIPAFLKISTVVLLLSFIPDFLLPDPNRTLLSSSLAALLHIVAAVFIVGGILTGYRMATRRS